MDVEHGDTLVLSPEKVKSHLLTVRVISELDPSTSLEGFHLHVGPSVGT